MSLTDRLTNCLTRSPTFRRHSMCLLKSSAFLGLCQFYNMTLFSLQDTLKKSKIYSANLLTDSARLWNQYYVDLVREALFWKILCPCGHCPNSFFCGWEASTEGVCGSLPSASSSKLFPTSLPLQPRDTWYWRARHWQDIGGLEGHTWYLSFFYTGKTFGE